MGAPCSLECSEALRCTFCAFMFVKLQLYLNFALQDMTKRIAICLWLIPVQTDQFHSTEGTMLVATVSKKALTKH